MNISQILTLGEDAAKGFGTSNIIMIVVLLVLMVAMFAMSIIPQKKRQKKAQEMVDSIKAGSKVKTIGGFVGEVTKVDNANNVFVLDISANRDGSVMVTIDRSAIYMVLEAVRTNDGEVKLQEKPEISALDDAEADRAAEDRKSKKKNSFDMPETEEFVPNDSLEKTDSESLLKD